MRSYSDGPLRARPPEEIRYGTGKSAVGPVLVASTRAGIVTIMVRKTVAQLAADIGQRFPQANLIRDEAGCKAVVAKVVKYVAAPISRFDLPLDIRGTEFQQRVWDEVRRIPFGQTSTYSRIAAAIGAPKAIRAVASSCSNSWFAFAVPCHRVLHKQAATPARRKQPGTVQYRWADYEADLAAELSEKRKRPARV